MHVHYEEKGDEKCQDTGDIRVMSSTNKMRFYGITQSATCYKGLHQQTIGVILERKILLWIQHKTDSYSIMGCCIWGLGLMRNVLVYSNCGRMLCVWCSCSFPVSILNC